MKVIEATNTTSRTLIAVICIALLASLGALADDTHPKPAAAAGADRMTDGARSCRSSCLRYAR